MFTGLVEELGRVMKREDKQGTVLFSIRARKTAKGLRKGESVAVEGVCLTAIGRRGSVFTVQAVEETLAKTTLGKVTRGSFVNLERPLKATGRIGGHFVLGHVDCATRVEKIQRRKGSWLFHVRIPRRFRKYLIPVGSVAINGVSLTVAHLASGSFSVSIIPHTWKVTTFQYLRVGHQVNVEFDVLGKYALNTRNDQRFS